MEIKTMEYKYARERRREYLYKGKRLIIILVRRNDKDA